MVLWGFSQISLRRPKPIAPLHVLLLWESMGYNSRYSRCLLDERENNYGNEEGSEEVRQEGSEEDDSEEGNEEVYEKGPC